MTVGVWLELVPFQNKECEDSRLDMSSSVVEPNLVHFLSDTRLDRWMRVKGPPSCSSFFPLTMIDLELVTELK
jgi:hypothetical protein